MERQFNAEIESLKLGEGETFHGEGILAVTKALLQSGVSYVGGYQGAPATVSPTAPRCDTRAPISAGARFSTRASTKTPGGARWPA